VLLVGGSTSPTTTEWVGVDGSPPTEGFPLSPPREMHCSIQLEREEAIVLTGGTQCGDSVIKYRLSTGEREELPGLREGREEHACGSYIGEGGEKVLIVVGGRTSTGVILETTELFDYSQSTQGWTLLPGTVTGPRRNLVGASINGLFYITGGSSTRSKQKEVMVWEERTQTWSGVKEMSEGRHSHGITPLNYFDIVDYCDVMI